MDMTLDGKVMLVTGGSAGIGAGIARVAAACGARVAVLSRDEAGLESVVNEIAEAGGTAMSVVADVTDDDLLRNATAKVVDRWERLDCLVANAGTNGTWTPIDEMEPEAWRRTIDVNLTGTFLAIRHAVPHIRDCGGGSVVIMSSINGTRTFTNEGASAYAASKAGQFALGKMLALELAPSNIRVNVICPGAIESSIHDKTKREDLDRIQHPVDFPEGKIPLTNGRMGTPRQIGELTVFLASDAAAHITGSPVWIDGGQSLVV